MFHKCNCSSNGLISFLLFLGASLCFCGWIPFTLLQCLSNHQALFIYVFNFFLSFFFLFLLLCCFVKHFAIFCHSTWLCMYPSIHLFIHLLFYLLPCTLWKNTCQHLTITSICVRWMSHSKTMSCIIEWIHSFVAVAASILQESLYTRF